MIQPLQAGDEACYYCGECCTEFEVLLEPKANETEQHQLGAKTPSFCPFCGKQEIEEP